MADSRTGSEKQKPGNSEAPELSSSNLQPQSQKNSRELLNTTGQPSGTCSSHANPPVRSQPTDKSSGTCSPQEIESERSKTTDQSSGTCRSQENATARPKTRQKSPVPSDSQEEASVRTKAYDQSSGVSKPSESLSVRPKVRPQELSVRPKIRPEVVSVRPKIRPDEFVSVRPKIRPDEFVSVRPKIRPDEFVSVRPKIRPDEFVSVRPKIIPLEVVSVRPKIIPLEVESVRPKTGPQEVMPVRSEIEDSAPRKVCSARPKITVRSSKIKKPQKNGKSKPIFWVPTEQPFYENMKSPVAGAVAVTPRQAEFPEACPRSCEYHTIDSGPFANVVSIHSPHTKHWQQELSCLERTRALCRYLLKVLPNWLPYLSTHSGKVRTLTNVARQTEREVFETADSKDEYFYMMREKSDYLIQMIGERSLDRPREPSPCRDRLPYHYDPHN